MEKNLLTQLDYSYDNEKWNPVIETQDAGGEIKKDKKLSDIEEEYIDKIAAVIEEASKGQSPFEISIKGSGAFPNLKNPRIIWIGVEDGTKGLTHLQQPLDYGLNAIGFEREEREFRPHLTLGRVKGPRGKERLSAAVSELKDIKAGSFIVDRVILYKSELKPTGAVYAKLKEVTLQKNVETSL